IPLRLVPAQLALWTGLVTPCVLVSRRFGSGHIRDDLGVRSRGFDPLIGFGLSWAGRLAAALLIVPLVLTSRRFSGGNDRVLRVVRGHPGDFALVAVIAVIGAPIVEELFFRGLLLRILESAWPAPAAVVAQAAIFGLCHISPLLGLANVT